MFSQNNGKFFSSREPQHSTSQFSNQGLGLGVDLTDIFSCASSVSEEAFPPSINDSHSEIGLTPAELAENACRIAAAEAARTSITDSALSALGIQLDADSFNEDQELRSPTKSISPQKHQVKIVEKHHDFFSNMANTPELLLELAKHLRIRDFISLYSISKDFHEMIKGHFSYCIRACAANMAPDSAKLYLFKFYSKLCVPDPAGRPHLKWPGQVRLVPGLKWLQMVMHREKAVHDILACMARQGHRMKPDMAFSLKKMWLIMDVSTTAGRIQMIHDPKLFTDIDLYNIQLFIVKLDMRFNDPVDGPGTEDLRKLFLGQRSLTPLYLLLKRKAFVEVVDVVKLAVRYSYEVRPEHHNMPIFGVPPEEIGIGHLEGWGKGRIHLMRPDELVIRESVRRQLRLKNYITEMMTWGYVDPITGKNIAVTEEEMYMSDDEKKGKGKGEVGQWSDYWEFEGSADEDSEEEGAEHDEDEDYDDEDGEDDDDEN